LALSIAVAISALHVLVLAAPVQRHVVGVFSDFYVRCAPDADRITAGRFPLNTYNPPGYPVALALAQPITGDHFTTGKWLSLLCGGLAGVLTFLLFRRVFGPGPALLAVPIVLTSEVFTTYALTAMSDVPFVALCLVVMLAITRDDPQPIRGAIVIGVLCGVAYLVRYNALFLLVPGVAAAVWGPGPWGPRLRRAAILLAAFVVTASPWLWMNYAHHGSPTYSTNFEDVARAFGITVADRPFDSLGDVIRRDPGRFVLGYLRNLPGILYRTVGAALALLPVGPLAVAGMAIALAWHRRKPVVLVLLAAITFVLLMTLTHWEKRYFLFVLVCYAGFAALAVVEIGRWIGARWSSPMAGRVAIAVLALWIIVPSAVLVRRAALKTLSRQPIELLPAAAALRREARPGATVMSPRAQIAYLSRLEWRDLPGSSSLDDLRAKLRAAPPDFISYDRWARKYAPALKALADPAQAPPWLRLVYGNRNITVYRVEIDRDSRP
jgi:4-amino-4-deoxy-L-arabinose transferase-like glycosyltransferase